MKISALCSRNVISIPASASVVEAARLMCEHSVGAVIVAAAPADKPVPVGILTDRDIVCAQLDRAVDLSQMRTGDVMAADPLVLSEEDPVDEAIRRMRARAVRRAPVIDRSGELTGVISLDDLLAHLAASLARLAQITDQARRHHGVPAAGRS